VTAGARPLAGPPHRSGEVDLQDILRWTIERFGEAQARVYAETLSRALEALASGPDVIGAKDRDDVAKGLFTLHVARHGRRRRHFVIFRIGHELGRQVIEVLRLLHDARELPHHLPPMVSVRSLPSCPAESYASRISVHYGVGGHHGLRVFESAGSAVAHHAQRAALL